MKKRYAYAVAGMLTGAMITLVVLFKASPALMIVEDESPLNHQQTVEAILTAANNNHWKIPKVHDLQKTMLKQGVQVPAVTVIELCQPSHAAKVLIDAESRHVTSMMPCRVAVYETEDARVIVSRMNTGLVSKVFNRNITEVMQTATQETEAILHEALKI